jgi:hypothetical protein
MVLTLFAACCSAWPSEVRLPTSFDVVVDLSSYTRRDTLSALREFAPRVGLYVYISSDSVYEVCVPPQEALRGMGGASSGDCSRDSGGGQRGSDVGGSGAAWWSSVEEDAVRPPPHSEARRRLRRADRYGHGTHVCPSRVGCC